MNTLDRWRLDQKRRGLPGLHHEIPSPFERFVCAQLDDARAESERLRKRLDALEGHE